MFHPPISVGLFYTPNNRGKDVNEKKEKNGEWAIDVRDNGQTAASRRHANPILKYREHWEFPVSIRATRISPMVKCRIILRSQN